MSVHVPVESMTPSQLEKRKLALQSVLRLVAELGVENVNIKAVSTNSGIALGTLYRFFNSKDHLFAAAIVDWQSPLVEPRVVSPPRIESRTPAERAFSYMRSGTRAFQHSPRLLGLMVYTTTSIDAFASEEMRAVRVRNVKGLSARIPEVPEPRRSTIVELLEACWWDMLVQWHAGRMTHEQIMQRIEESVTLLLGSRFLDDGGDRPT